jgi:hypothetical protein
MSPEQLALPITAAAPAPKAEVPRAAAPAPLPCDGSCGGWAPPAPPRPAAVVDLESRLLKHVVETPDGPRTWLAIVAESCALEPRANIEAVLEGAGERADGGAGKITNGWDRPAALPSRLARDRSWYELARLGKLMATQIAAAWGLHQSGVNQGISRHRNRMNLAARVEHSVLASSHRRTG